jgi:hypothetical protein
MSLFTLYVLFGIGLIGLELILGMTLGVALAGAITLVALGILTRLGFLHTLNEHLGIGAILFILSTISVLRLYRNKRRSPSTDDDVNQY